MKDEDLIEGMHLLLNPTDMPRWHDRATLIGRVITRLLTKTDLVDEPTDRELVCSLVLSVRSLSSLIEADPKNHAWKFYGDCVIPALARVMDRFNIDR